VIRRGPPDRGCELYEELVGELFSDPVDQSLPELGKFAADLRLDMIDQQRPSILRLKGDFGATLGEPGNPAVALPRDPVAVGRIEIGELDLALEPRLDGSDLVTATA